MNAEEKRLTESDARTKHWKRWGPYLSERAWGTVREDYSAYGSAWEYFPHDHARSRAYRWNEDGIAGISDRHQMICFALALWNGRDPILVDTAGRLHTRVNLMQELDKIRRIAAREVAGAPQEVLLVLDATVGQNGVTQAREFMSAAGVNGIVLTKLDGTAKGGVAVAIAHDLKLPIRYVGVGEGIDDLVPFSADEYVDGLFEEKW